MKYLESVPFVADFIRNCLGLTRVPDQYLDNPGFRHPETKHVLHIDMDFGEFLNVVKRMSPGDIVLILPLSEFGYYHVPYGFTYKMFDKWITGQLGVGPETTNQLVKRLSET